MSVFFHFFIKGKSRKFINIVPPILGFLFCFLIWINLRIQAQIAGAIWISIGMVVGFINQKGSVKTYLHLRFLKRVIHDKQPMKNLLFKLFCYIRSMSKPFYRNL